MIDMIGKRFGRLLVIERAENSSDGRAMWLCQCDCGNQKIVLGKSLRRNLTQSCGCLKKERTSETHSLNLIGKRFGKLLVIERLGQIKNDSKVYWKCLCDCGNISYVNTNNLQSKNTQSCGCINYSIGEKNVEECLKNNNISFISQFTNKELNKKKFDFAILDNKKIIRLIEYDGEQHFDCIRGYWNSKNPEKDFLKRQKLDKEKNQWAKEHNIPLVRIPYWERDKITLEIILGDKYLV